MSICSGIAGPACPTCSSDLDCAGMGEDAYCPKCDKTFDTYWGDVDYAEPLYWALEHTGRPGDCRS